MAGIYIHIPFCRQACVYCDFHFTTSPLYRKEVVDAICRELQQRKNYLGSVLIDTLYFGGGTPSQLSDTELGQILEVVFSEYEFTDLPEVTLEANPDDLSDEYLRFLKSAGINRLSIGVQSFFEADLRFMNRAHSANQAVTSVEKAALHGFNQLSIDLIFGTPGLSDKNWQLNLEQAANLPVNHLSCYSLTVESGTPLAKNIRTGKSAGTDEDQSANQFEILQQFAPDLGFEHYEISNLARAGNYARHNTAYWKNVPYLGIGPSAHSFDGVNRRVNVPNNQSYWRATGDVPHEIEELTAINRYNEIVLTGLRTKWGIAKQRVMETGESFSLELNTNIRPFIASGEIIETADAFLLNRKCWLRADGIASDLMV